MEPDKAKYYDRDCDDGEAPEVHCARMWQRMCASPLGIGLSSTYLRVPSISTGTRAKIVDFFKVRLFLVHYKNGSINNRYL